MGGFKMGPMPFIGAGLVLVQVLPSLLFGCAWTPGVHAAWIWPCTRDGFSIEECIEQQTYGMNAKELEDFYQRNGLEAYKSSSVTSSSSSTTLASTTGQASTTVQVESTDIASSSTQIPESTTLTSSTQIPDSTTPTFEANFIESNAGSSLVSVGLGLMLLFASAFINFIG